MDGVICNNTPSRYHEALPNKEVIAYMRKLREAGHYIIINTARKMETYSGNLGKVQANVAYLTLQQLTIWKVPYDEIYWGKPSADVYIDDKGFKFESAEQLEEMVNGLCSN